MEEIQLILASQSPRRRELLSLTGIPFLVDAPEVDETCSLGAREAVLALARRKALAAADKRPGKVILASDTLVAVDDIPLGKPADEADAFRMLRSLADRWHQVYTGVCVVSATGEVFAEVDATDVRFGPMSDEAIRAYIATSEPMDKAGAYGIQGGAALFADRLEGDYYNVMGLPVCRLNLILKEFMEDGK